jgi:hypothetical protein
MGITAIRLRFVNSDIPGPEIRMSAVRLDKHPCASFRIHPRQERVFHAKTAEGAGRLIAAV